MRRTRLTVALSTLLVIAVSPALYGAGYSIFEQGAKATGMGGAFTATADDPSAMFYNVAGLAYQREIVVMGGATLITFKNEFDGKDYEFPGPGTTERYEDHLFTPPNGYIVYPIGENMTFGIGAFTAFGLRTHWEDQAHATGRFISQDTNLKTVSVQPSFAWKTSDDRFAVGFGVEWRGSKLSLDRNISAVNPFTLTVADIGHVRLESDDVNDDIGFNVGFMYRPLENWSFGLNYRSDQTIDYDGDATFTQILTGNPEFDALVSSILPPDQKIKTQVPFPSIVHFGVATTMIDTWTLEFDAVLMTWSDFETLIVDFQDPTTEDLVVPENWDDSWSYRLGANKAIDDNWSVQFGLLWDETPQPAQAVSPILPDSNRVGFSFGIGFTNGKWMVSLSDLYLPFSDRDTKGLNQDNFNGEYQTTANLISFNVGLKF